MTDAPSIQILVTPDFQGQLRKLAKRYRNMRSDLQPLFDDLESGNCPGDQIPGTTHTVFKVRIKNSDIQKGKSSGYRVIYQLRDNICILLVTLYSKSDETTLTTSEIREISEFAALYLQYTSPSRILRRSVYPLSTPPVLRAYSSTR